MATLAEKGISTGWYEAQTTCTVTDVEGNSITLEERASFKVRPYDNGTFNINTQRKVATFHDSEAHKIEIAE